MACLERFTTAIMILVAASVTMTAPCFAQRATVTMACSDGKPPHRVKTRVAGGEVETVTCERK
jgi:hypothetical protein